MTTLLERLRDLLRGEANPDPPPAIQPGGEAPVPAELDEACLARLMRQVQLTREGEYTCAETADLLDEYVDLVAGKQDAERLLPLVKHHLDHCVDCTERYEALLAIVAQEA